MSAIGANFVRGRIGLLLALALVGGLTAAGCSDVPADEATGSIGPTGPTDSTDPTAPTADQTYSIAITVATTAALPKCTTSLAGQVGFVTSNSSLWSCYSAA